MRRAADWPLDRFAVIERAWPGATCVCIAGGPSLGDAQIDTLAQWRARDPGLRVIAINDAYRLAPWADILYFADPRWREWHVERPAYQAFAGVQITIEGSWGWEALVEVPGLWVVKNYGQESGSPLCTQRNGLATGQNSGYQAINLAYLLGAARIVLLGYDMKAAGDGRVHWFGDHPIKTEPSIFSAMRLNFRALAPELKRRGIVVLNATPGSALDCFPHVALESLVADPHAAVVSA